MKQITLGLIGFGTIGTGGGASAADHTVTLTSVNVLAGASGIESTVSPTAPAAGYTQIAYASVPTITLSTLPSTILAAGTKTISKVSISSAGGNISWKALAFTIASSSHVGDITGLALYDSSNVAITGTFYNTASASITAAAGAAADGIVIFVPDVEEQINGSETYSLKGTVVLSGTLVAGDNISTTIANPGAAPVATSYAGQFQLATKPSFIWSDQSVTSPAHGETTADWHNDYLIKNLPTLYDGTHINHPLAERQSARRIDYELDGPVDVS